MLPVNNVTTSEVNPQPQITSEARVEGARNSRLSEVAQNVQVGEAPAPRVHRSAASIVGRVILGIVTAGISEAVIAIINKVHANSIENARRAALERSAQTTQFHETLADAIRDGEFNNLPGAHRAAIEDAFSSLKREYQDFFTDPNINLPRLLEDSRFSIDVKEALANLPEEVTPEALKSLMLDKVRPHMRDAILQMELKDAFSAVNMPETLPAKIGLIPGMFRAVGGETLAQYEGALDVINLHNLVTNSRELIKDYAGYMKQKEDIVSGELNKAMDRLGEQLHLSRDEVQQYMDMRELKGALQNRIRRASFGDDLSKVAQDCQAKTEQFIENRLTHLQNIPNMDASATLKDIWMQEVLTGRDIRPDNYEKAKEVAAKVPQEAIDSFRKDIRNSLLTPQEMGKIIEDFGQVVFQAVRENAPALFNTQVSGAEAMPQLCKSVIEVIFDSNRELLSAIRPHANQLEQARENFTDQATPAAVFVLDVARHYIDYNGKLAQIANQPQSLSLPYATAMNEAVKSFTDDLGMALPDDIFSIVTPYGRLDECLARSIKTEAYPVTAEQFGTMIRDYLCQSPQVKSAMQERYGDQFDAPFFNRFGKDIAFVMAKYHIKPDSPEAQQVIDMFRGIQDGQKLLNEGADRMASKLGSITSLTRETVVKHLDQGMLGNEFSRELYGSINRLKSGRDTTLKSYDELISHFSRDLDAVIDKRLVLHRTIDELPISQELKQSLHIQHLQDFKNRKVNFLTLGHQLAQKVDLAPLAQTLQQGANAQVEEITQQLFAFGLQYDEASPGVLKELGNGVAPEDAIGIQLFALPMAIDKTQGLKEAFAQLSDETVDAVNDHLREVETQRLAEMMQFQDMHSEEAAAAKRRYAEVSNALMLWQELTSTRQA